MIMTGNSLFEQLIEDLESWPGIGPRQARRLAYWLAGQPRFKLIRTGNLLQKLPEVTKMCHDCKRLFWSESQDSLCSWCRNLARKDATQLMIVEKDIDMDNVQKISDFQGYFFVLGGLLPLNDKGRNTLRLSSLKSLIEKKITEGKLKEVIFALSVSPEGDHTVDHLKQELKPFLVDKDITVSILGRGLSAGTDLEYLDPETLKNAWRNRQNHN